MDDLLTTIAAIDGTWFAAGVLFFAAFVIYVANQIAKLGQTQAVEPDVRDLDGNVAAFDAMGARGR